MFILVKRWRNAMAKSQTDNHNQTKTKKEKSYYENRKHTL